MRSTGCPFSPAFGEVGETHHIPIFTLSRIVTSVLATLSLAMRFPAISYISRLKQRRRLRTLLPQR